MAQERTKRVGLTRLAVLALGLLILVEPVLAHIPHASWLMSRMAHARDKMGIRRTRVEMSCGLSDTDQKKETLYLSSPKQVRHEREGSLLICRDRKCALKVGEAKPVTQPEWVYLRYLYFSETRSGEGWMRLIRALKVNTKVDTLARAGSRIAFVLGAKEWERDRPQIWLDKERFLPLRLMVRDGGSLVEIRYDNWGTRVAGDWFPEKIEIHRDGKLVERCMAKDVEVNKSMSVDLFKF